MASTFRVGDNLGVEYGETLGENNWDDEYNDAMQLLDTTVMCAIESVEAAQPGAPSEGDRYIASTNWGGACAVDDLALYAKDNSGAAASWHYYTPKTGWRCYDKATDTWRFYISGTGWVEYPRNQIVENTDVDTGTETVDSFPDTKADGCAWDYVVKNSAGGDYRAGIVTAVWEASTDTVEYTESSTLDIGDTSDLTLSVDINANTVRLRATAASDDWSVRAVRRII